MNTTAVLKCLMNSQRSFIKIQQLRTHNSLQNIPKQLSALAVSKAYAVDLSPQLCFKTAGRNENNRLVPCKYKCYPIKDGNIKNCILVKK